MRNIISIENLRTLNNKLKVKDLIKILEIFDSYPGKNFTERKFFLTLELSYSWELKFRDLCDLFIHEFLSKTSTSKIFHAFYQNIQ